MTPEDRKRVYQYDIAIPKGTPLCSGGRFFAQETGPRLNGFCINFCSRGDDPAGIELNGDLVARKETVLTITPSSWVIIPGQLPLPELPLEKFPYLI
jgi:hypothetical protein